MVLKVKPALFLIIFCVFGAVAHADYLQPTDAKDCYLTRIPLWGAKKTQMQQAFACSKQSSNSPFSRDQSEKTSCWGRVAKDCVQFYQRACDMEDRLDAVVNACYSKLGEYRLREKEIRQAQKDFEREQRDRSEAERRDAQTAHREHLRQQARFWQDSTRYAMNKERLGPEGKYALQLQSRARLAGKIGLRILGIQKPYSGGHSLSDQLTRAGTRFILGANAAAQQDLRDALAGFDDSLGGGYNSVGRGIVYDPSNPRPTSTQIEESFALFDRLQAHIQRVAQTEYKLPLGNTSVVDTATGRLLSQIVKARAGGDIDSLSDALTQYAGAIRQQAIDEWEPPAEQTVSGTTLHQERLAVLAVVEKEAKRIAAKIAASRPKPSAQRDAMRGGRGSNKYNATRCASIEYRAAYTGKLMYFIKNQCSKRMHCDIIAGRHRTTAGSLGPQNYGAGYLVPITVVGCRFY